MSTSCMIGLKLNGPGKSKIKAVYCHNDGYLAGVGKTLLEFYKTKERVETLLDLGNLSSLGIEPVDNPELWNLNNAKNFDIKYCHATCRTYKGRGETNTDAIIYDSLEEFVSENYTRDYLYIFDYTNDNEWGYIKHTNNGEVVIPLKKLILNETELKKAEQEKVPAPSLQIENKRDELLIDNPSGYVYQFPDSFIRRDVIEDAKWEYGLTIIDELLMDNANEYDNVCMIGTKDELEEFAHSWGYELHPAYLCPLAEFGWIYINK